LTTNYKLLKHRRGITDAKEGLNHFAAHSSYKKESVAKDDKSDRKEPERRPEQAKRMAAFSGDTVANERLQKPVQDLEEKLRKSE
jgi:hypothetical protein